MRLAKAPTRMMCCVPEPLHIGSERGEGLETVTCARVWCLFSRRRGQGWGIVQEPHSVDTDMLWDYLATYTDQRSRLLIMAPNGADLLTLAGYWKEVHHRRWWMEGSRPGERTTAPERGKRRRHYRAPLVISPRTCMTGGRCESGPMVCYSLTQYASIDLGPADQPARQCAALAAFMRSAISDWIGRGWGPWQATAARLGHSAWAALGKPRNVAGHRSEQVAGLEGYACHGGRASVWFTGPVGDRSTVRESAMPAPDDGDHRLPGTRVHRVDVTSMYPYLLGTMSYPDRLRSVLESPPLSQLRGYCKSNRVIAKVKLRSDTGEYPVRTGDRTIYPAGTFWTALAGPELLRAVEEGAVLECPVMLRYGCCRPFRAWYEAMMQWRADAKNDGNLAAEALAKQVSNAFAGKFTQRKRRWKDVRGVQAKREWGEWVHSDYRAKVQTHYRAVAGRVQVSLPATPSAKLPAAVYAYLTAYGRDMMRSLRESLPPRSVISQDTDGLWVTDAGYLALIQANALADRVPGRLRWCETVDYGRWYEARRYFAGDRWTVAGLARDFTVDRDFIGHGAANVNPACGDAEGVPVGLTRYIQAQTLIGSDPLHCPDADGWHRPRVKLAGYEHETPPGVTEDPWAWLYSQHEATWTPPDSRR